MFWIAKSGYQYKVWPEERLQECYVLCLCLEMAPVWDARLTKLKLPVRICVQLLTVFFDFFVQDKLCFPDGFPPNQASALPSVPLCNSESRLMGQIPQFCYRKRDILVSWLHIAGRFLRLYFGKEGWCFWPEMSTSVLHRGYLVPSLQPRYKTDGLWRSFLTGYSEVWTMICGTVL